MPQILHETGVVSEFNRADVILLLHHFDRIADVLVEKYNCNLQLQLKKKTISFNVI